MSAPNLSDAVLLSHVETHHIQSLPILILNVHSRCNCRCIMCDIWKVAETRTVRDSDLQPHMESLRTLGVRHVVFSGGEPLMNPGLWTLCRMLKAQGIALTLLSSGLLLEKHAAAIATDLDETIVSLDGPPEVHDRIRGVRGAFKQLQSGIAAVRRYRPGFPVSGRTTVQRGNFRELRRTVAAAQELGLDSISFLAADLTSVAFNRSVPWSPERQNEIRVGPDDIEALEQELEKLIRENAAEIRGGFIRESPPKLRRVGRHFRAHLRQCEPEAPSCNAPWVSAVVEADGSVRPCFFHRSIGKLEDGALINILNNPEAVSFRENLNIGQDPICRRCVCSLHYRVNQS